MRDGFAVRAADLPGELDVIGEVRAGERFAGEVGPGQAVEIMTGAPLPAGADAVVMVEHTRREDGRVVIDRAAEPGQFINPRRLRSRGRRSRAARRQAARLHRRRAARRRSDVPRVKVFRRPTRRDHRHRRRNRRSRTRPPRDFQIRNSNA